MAFIFNYENLYNCSNRGIGVSHSVFWNMQFVFMLPIQITKCTLVKSAEWDGEGLRSVLLRSDFLQNRVYVIT